MTANISIDIKGGHVEVFNTTNRAHSLKQRFLGKSKIISPSINILKNINLSIRSGEKIAFIGCNGSGKSTLLKAIAGIYPLSQGTRKIHGEVTAIIETGIGFELEFSGRDNIRIAMLYNNILHKHSLEFEEKVIEFAELGEKIDWPIKTYSTGMLAKLAFSIAVLQEPEILLLDEVFATGDRHFITKSLEAMKNRISVTPITIMVSHQDDIILAHCNRCILLKGGQIIADGPADEIINLYNSENY